MRAPILCGKPVRGVVLDLDGTLINTTVDFGLMKRRVMSELTSWGIPPARLNGRGTTADNLEQATAYLSAHGRGDEVGQLHHILGEVMNRTELERVSETTAIEGALDCLVRLRGSGLRIGLLTRGSREYAKSALRHADLDFEFGAMVCRDDFPEEEAKPNGKAMERIAGMLDLRPEECILVGDHAMDLSCARSVSAGFVGVLSGSFGKDDWSRNGCAVIIASVEALPRLLFEQKS